MVFGLKLSLAKSSKVAETTPLKDDRIEKKNAVRTSETDKGGGGARNDTQKDSGSGHTRSLTVNEFVARTKKSREKGLEPTKPELIAYARYLGIDAIADGDLMWIAEESLAAPLPAEWTEHNDNHSRVFYYNVETHASSWTHPLEQLHRDTYKKIVHFRSGELSKEEQGRELERLRKQVEDAERAAHQELQAWTEHTDESGQKFYYNREHKRSVWTDPRPARCHELYLQMKALGVLGKICGNSVTQLANSTNGGRGPKPLSADMSEVATQERINRLKQQKLGPRPIDLSDDDSMSERHSKERERKKKKHHKSSADYSGDEHHDSNEEKVPPVPLDWRNPLLDLKKPSTAMVNEVRQAIGVQDSLGLGPSLRGGVGGLPAYEGDGLQSVGRTRVRAGIKLEPLKAG